VPGCCPGHRRQAPGRHRIDGDQLLPGPRDGTGFGPSPGPRATLRLSRFAVPVRCPQRATKGRRALDESSLRAPYRRSIRPVWTCWPRSRRVRTTPTAPCRGTCCPHGGAYVVTSRGRNWKRSRPPTSRPGGRQRAQADMAAASASHSRATSKAPSRHALGWVCPIARSISRSPAAIARRAPAIERRSVVRSMSGSWGWGWVPALPSQATLGKPAPNRAVNSASSVARVTGASGGVNPGPGPAPPRCRSVSAPGGGRGVCLVRVLTRPALDRGFRTR
jgi:hypothetical protein